MTPTLIKEISSMLGVAEDEVSSAGMMVPADRHVEFARLLKSAGYTFYLTVVASHWPVDPKAKKADPEAEDYFEVATVLRNPDEKGDGTFAWRVKLAEGEAIETLYPIFAGADWQEREQYDLVGVRFAKHPDLRRLMMPEDWEGHPLRRDYAIETPHKPWR